MQASERTLSTRDGSELFVNRWLPDGPPKAVVQVAHGMAEHSTRYARFAQRLTDHGYAVYADDHRGHGRTPGDEGYFTQTHGWDVVVDDLHDLTRLAKEEQPGLPVFLLGHSMGSFLARSYAAAHGSEIAGLVLIGTTGDPGALGKVGVQVAKVESRLRGPKHRSAMLNTLTFGSYNKAFKPTRTDFDWLSRDEAEVDAYIADPKCGFVFTSGGYVDLVGGILAISSDAVIGQVPKDLPVHFVAGSMDPVGAQGKGVKEVADRFRSRGVRDVTVTLWPEGRHEVLNEMNRDEVEAEIVDWLDAHLTPAG